MGAFSKFSEITYKYFYGLFIIFFLWVFFLNIKVDFAKGPIIFFFSLVFLMGFVFLRKICANQLERKQNKTTINIIIKFIFWLLLFLFISLIGLSMRVEPSWDYNTVHTDALEWARNGQFKNLAYFARYPNNNLILMIIATFYKCLHHFFPNGSDVFYIQCSIIFNSIFVTFSIYFTSLSAKLLYGNRFKLLSIIFMLFFTPVLLYTEILYTDTVGLFFVSLISFLLIKRMSTFRILDMLLLGILFALGYKIKAFIAIIMIALMIVLFLKNKLKFVYKFILIFFLLTSFSIASVSISSLLDRFIGLNASLYDQYQFPTTHWLMMALNPNLEGGFNQKDVEETISVDGKNNKKLIIKQKIEDRIKLMGGKGVAKHYLYKKNKRTWTLGSLAIDDYSNRKNVYHSFMQDFFTNDGRKHRLYEIISQATHLVLIILVLGSGFLCFAKPNDSNNLVNLSIFGIALFLTVWECNPRYLFSFIPLLSLASLQFLSNTPKKKRTKHSKKTRVAKAV